MFFLLSVVFSALVFTAGYYVGLLFFGKGE